MSVRDSSLRRMSVGTSRQLCRHVAERWHSQYGDDPHNPKHAGVQAALNALKKKGTRAEIDAIIGNSTWTTEMCDCCERRVDVWVAFGSSSYESPTNLCAECLEDAVVEVENAV